MWQNVKHWSFCQNLCGLKCKVVKYGRSCVISRNSGIDVARGNSVVPHSRLQASTRSDISHLKPKPSGRRAGSRRGAHKGGEESFNSSPSPFLPELQLPAPLLSGQLPKSIYIPLINNIIIFSRPFSSCVCLSSLVVRLSMFSEVPIEIDVLKETWLSFLYDKFLALGLRMLIHWDYQCVYFHSYVWLFYFTL